MTDRPPFAAAVLTGGASRRMGVDKAGLLVDGVPMAVRVADALRAAGAAEVVLIGRPVGDEVTVADRHPGEGPLGGVLTALAEVGRDAGLLVVAPCDLLTPEPGAFAALVDAMAAHPAALGAVAGPGDPLPLALRPAATAVLAEAFTSGERSLRQAVGRLDPVDAGLAAAATADADEPDDLAPGAG